MWVGSCTSLAATLSFSKQPQVIMATILDTVSCNKVVQDMQLKGISFPCKENPKFIS